MKELKLDQLKQLAGGAGSCGNDKGGSTSTSGGCKNTKSSKDS